jgi:hypothetical protein
MDDFQQQINRCLFKLKGVKAKHGKQLDELDPEDKIKFYQIIPVLKNFLFYSTLVEMMLHIPDLIQMLQILKKRLYKII